MYTRAHTEAYFKHANVRHTQALPRLKCIQTRESTNHKSADFHPVWTSQIRFNIPRLQLQGRLAVRKKECTVAGQSNCHNSNIFCSVDCLVWSVMYLFIYLFLFVYFCLIFVIFCTIFPIGVLYLCRKLRYKQLVQQVETPHNTKKHVYFIGETAFWQNSGININSYQMYVEKG